jgi:hypothetical protein
MHHGAAWGLDGVRPADLRGFSAAIAGQLSAFRVRVVGDL